MLTVDELRTVGELGRRSESHYGVPQDVEFAVEDGAVFLTQTRPITTLAERAVAAAVATPARHEAPRVHGLGASPGTATGPVRLLASPDEAAKLKAGEVLVTHMTSPDWVPIMRRAAAVVTDAGGMTSHAAIVSRELGIPCVVGTRDGTRRLADGDVVRVDGAAGTVVPATEAELAAATTAPAPAPATSTATSTATAPATEGATRLVTGTKLYVNLSEPDRAEEVARLDVDGVGLLRAELMMLTALDRTHPRRLLEEKREGEFVERMATQLRTFAQAFAPRPIVYRAMDFRSNEYRGLAGGDAIEMSNAADSDALERHLASSIVNDGVSAFVFNFIDLLTHGRSESMILYEVARDEAALRQLTRQWFQRSSLQSLLREAARRKARVLLTSDHGSILCNTPATVFAKRDATANLRYKFGEDLRAERAEHALTFTNSDDLRLPRRGWGSNTLLGVGDTFFVYPTKLREYQSRYRGSFLHGGVTPEEVILPLAVLTPR